MRTKTRTELYFAVYAASLILASSILAIAEDITETADKPAAAKAPVKVFILSGQSNMTGRGELGDLGKPAAEQKATLVRYMMEPENAGKYEFIYNGTNKTREGWTVRDDVFITIGSWPHDGSKTAGKHGGLAPYYGGFRNKGFGPELGIGHMLGNFYSETVVLIKDSYGANNLAVNFRPPSSGGIVGDKYPLLVKAVHNAIEHLSEIVPGYDPEQGYEIAGFFWNQGEHDASESASAEYGQNLANLIKDLRTEFKAPEMKAVIAVTGVPMEDKEKAFLQKVQEAQLAVPNLPEFTGTVATVETRSFFRPQAEFGGNNQTIHWHGNGESYWLVGEAMGREMVKLLDLKK